MVVRKPFIVFILLITLFTVDFSTAQEGLTDKRIGSEYILPNSTTGWASAPSVITLLHNFQESNFGRLGADPELVPFFKSMSDQVRDWADEKNVRLGLTLDEIQELDAAEVCIAGILPRPIAGGADAGKVHGVVLLMDVAESLGEAQELIESVNGKMLKAGAKKKEIEPINGVEVSKWKWVHVDREKVERDHTTLQAIVDGWLVASDNEDIFRQIIRRIQDPGLKVENTLAANPNFVEVANRTKIENVPADFRWFVDPFGYMKLAQAIAEEGDDVKERHDDVGAILEAQGFDAIKGVGGSVAFSNSDRDMIYRLFAHTPPVAKPAQKRARGILDFRNKAGHSFFPETWVPSGIYSYSTLSWDVESAFTNFGEVFDAFFDPGAWKGFVNGMNQDLQVDLRKLVTQFDGRFSLMSATEKPISVESERVVMAIGVKDDVEGVFQSVVKLVGVDGQVEMIGGRSVLVVDKTIEDPDPGFGGGFDPNQFGLDDEEDQGEDEEEKEEFNLFAKRYFTAIPKPGGAPGGYIIVANNADHLTKILDAAKGLKTSKLLEEADFSRVNGELDKLIDPSKLSVRKFGRSDKVFETNYQMIREGRMAESQTVLARILNEILKSDIEEEAREQQIDGTKLPKNYNEVVGPYLGPAGWAMETHPEGWLITGVVLKKKGLNKIVHKQDDEPKPRR